MSMGIEGAFGANEFQKALRQKVLDELAAKQQEFQNSMAVRGADRADRSLAQTDELTRLKIQEMADARSATDSARQFTLAEKANESVPAGTVFPSVDGMQPRSPLVGRLQMVGALAPSAGVLGSTADTKADPKTGTPPSGRLIAMPEGQVKLPSATQANVLSDNARADAKDAEAARRAGQNLPLVPVGPRGILTPHDEAIGQPMHTTPKDTSGRDDNRMDRSFTYTDKQLTDLAKPLGDQAERIGRLRATINQMTPQADSLIAPELLTAMAGGQGSGLRMNEAEISRIVGGRNQWQSLKAKLEAWQLDPSQPFAVTPEQRVQMRSLVKAIADRGQQRLTDIGSARRALIDAPDVNTHRRIVQDVTDKLNASAIGTDGPTKETWVRDAQGKLVKSSGQ